MTRKIIVATHGQFGKYLIESAAMIAGEMEEVTAIGLEADMAPENFVHEVEKHLKDYEGKVLILVDLFGGTPFNSSAYMMKNYDVEIITGVNLPLLIELYNSFILNISDDIGSIMETAKESIKHIEKIV